MIAGLELRHSQVRKKGRSENWSWARSSRSIRGAPAPNGEFNIGKKEVKMPDSWRAIGRESVLSGEAVLVVEIKLNRSILFRKADFEKVRELLGPENMPHVTKDLLLKSFDGLETFTRSFFETEMSLEVRRAIQTPWQPLVLTAEALDHLVEVLKGQEGEMWANYSGDVSTGSTITFAFGGRPYELSLRTASQAHNVRLELEAVAAQAKFAGLKKLFDFIRELVDWVARWELTRELYERAKEAKEAQEARDRELKDFREKLQEAADASEPVGHDNMAEFDRVSRSC